MVKKPHILYIKADSWEKFQSLIEPYVIPHFAYKLTLRGSPYFSPPNKINKLSLLSC